MLQRILLKSSLLKQLYYKQSFYKIDRKQINDNIFLIPNKIKQTQKERENIQHKKEILNTLYQQKLQQQQQQMNTNNNSLNQQQQTQKQQQTQTIQDKDDDVHAKRFLQSIKVQDDKETIQNQSQQSNKETFRFNFEESHNAIDLNLDDLNQIEMENKSSYNITPVLAHNLDIVLKYPGHIFSIDEISKLQPDNGEFLRRIPQPEEITFENISSYVPPSQDQQLLKFACDSKIKYIMSTSTISNVLCQIYYLFSGFKNPQFDKISGEYDNEPKKYMISQRKPITNMLRVVDKENQIYAFDSDSGLFKFKNTILMNLGKIIEKQLTLDQNIFNEALVKKQTSPQTQSEEQQQQQLQQQQSKQSIEQQQTAKEESLEKQNLKIDEDHHRFMKLNGNICLRAQIDCRSKDSEGKDYVFEIKTRSACPIRYDLPNYQDYLDYKIIERSGIHSSFEREYYDLIRGALLKYSFQLKIGAMDGAFVAYHNTKEMFGFEYIKRTEIERRVFGNEQYADIVFLICSKILTTVIDLVLDDLKSHKFERLRLGFYSCSHLKKMTIFAELIKDNVEWGKDSIIDQTEDIKDEYDYFTKMKKFDNQVVKYEFYLYPFINNVLQRYNNFSVSAGDQIKVKYKFKKIGKPSFLDYMNFLHEAFKFDSVNLDLSYVGAWVKN